MNILESYKEKKKLTKFVKNGSSNSLELVTYSEIPILSKLPTLAEINDFKVFSFVKSKKTMKYTFSQLKIKPTKLKLELKSGFLLLSKNEIYEQNEEERKEKQKVALINLKDYTLLSKINIQEHVYNSIDQLLDESNSFETNVIALSLESEKNKEGVILEISDSLLKAKLEILLKSELNKQNKLEQLMKTSYVGSRIGKGFFGSINLLFSDKAGKEQDIKVIKKVKLTEKVRNSNSDSGSTRKLTKKEQKRKQVKSQKYKLSYVYNERILLEELNNTKNSTNLTKLLYSFEANNALYLVYNLHEGDNLLSLLDDKNSFNEYLSEETIQYIFKGIVKGLKSLHDLNIAHRDLKPENIMITRKAEVKLIDFGLSRKFKTVNDSSQKLEKSYEILGTIYYQAPEMLKCLGHDLTADYWQLGVVLYEMFFGKPLFNASSEKFIEKRIKSNATIFLPSTRPMSSSARFLLLELLIREPTDRLGYQNGCEDILNQEFLSVDTKIPQTLKDYAKGMSKQLKKLIDSSSRTVLQSFVDSPEASRNANGIIAMESSENIRKKDSNLQNFDRLGRLGLSYVM